MSLTRWAVKMQILMNESLISDSDKLESQGQFYRSEIESRHGESICEAGRKEATEREAEQAESANRLVVGTTLGKKINKNQ